MFGVRPSLGRGFTAEETRPGRRQVVILGYGFWQRWFAGDPGVLGRQLIVPDGSLTIVGVGPPGFRIGLTEPDVFTPLTIDPANPAATGSRAFQCYGRLAPGVTARGGQRRDVRHRLGAPARSTGSTSAWACAWSDLHDFLVEGCAPGLRLLMAVVATVLASPA